MKGLIGYLEGTMLILIDPSTGKDATWKPDTAEQTTIAKYSGKLVEWRRENAYIK